MRNSAKTMVPNAPLFKKKKKGNTKESTWTYTLQHTHTVSDSLSFSFFGIKTIFFPFFKRNLTKFLSRFCRNFGPKKKNNNNFVRGEHFLSLKKNYCKSFKTFLVTRQNFSRHEYISTSGLTAEHCITKTPHTFKIICVCVCKVAGVKRAKYGPTHIKQII